MKIRRIDKHLHISNVNIPPGDVFLIHENKHAPNIENFMPFFFL